MTRCMPLARLITCALVRHRYSEMSQVDEAGYQVPSVGRVCTSTAHPSCCTGQPLGTCCWVLLLGPWRQHTCVRPRWRSRQQGPGVVRGPNVGTPPCPHPPRRVAPWHRVVLLVNCGGACWAGAACQEQAYVDAKAGYAKVADVPDRDGAGAYAQNATIQDSNC